MRPTKEARARFRLNLFETRSARLDRRGVGFALFTAVTICAYSVVDGMGARLAGSANAYSAALFAGLGPVMASYALARRGREVIPAMGRHWRLGLAGGTLQLGSYAIAIWAMTVAPIAIVAALRETSVLFGAVIAVTFLKEPLRAGRVVAALMIVAGLTLIRLYLALPPPRRRHRHFMRLARGSGGEGRFRAAARHPRASPRPTAWPALAMSTRAL